MGLLNSGFEWLVKHLIPPRCVSCKEKLKYEGELNDLADSGYVFRGSVIDAVFYCAGCGKSYVLTYSVCVSLSEVEK